jgi:hypothetical protein
MSKAIRIILAIGCVGALGLLVVSNVRQQHANAALRAQNVALQSQLQQQAAENENLRQARAENERLRRVKLDSNELERLRTEHAELLRLRGEVGLLRRDKAELDRIKSTSVTPSARATGTAGNSNPRSPGGSLVPPVSARRENDGAVDPQREAEFLEHITSPANRVSWSPGQAAGAPDTHAAGDIRTAWASQSQDGGPEWLKLDYERPMEIAQVRVRETHNPGAVASITATLENGSEITLWQGEEPRGEAPVEMEFSVPGGVVARTVTVHLDTQRVPGWNEIDAVELVGRDGSRQWAKSATASSYYGQGRARELNALPSALPAAR